MMNNTIVTTNTVIAEGKWTWQPVACEYVGIIPGYLCGFSVEMQKTDGSYGYSSFVYTDDINGWDIERMVELCSHHGNKFTGRVVFGGYFTEYYDYEEREECVLDKSDEVMRLWHKYVS